MTSDIFSEIGHNSLVYNGEFVADYLSGIAQLPDPTDTNIPINEAYLLTKFCTLQHNGTSTYYKAGRVYILREIDGVRQWIESTHYENGSLAAPTNFWKRLTPDAVILHWTDPEDITDAGWNNATWDHDIIVCGSLGEGEPEDITDGIVVGISTIKNQYAEGTLGFVDAVDQGRDYDFTHRYKVFSVTKCGKVTPTATAQRSTISWLEVSDYIANGLYKKAFRIGDILRIPGNAGYPGSIVNYAALPLYAQLVDFDTANVYDSNNVLHEHNITFMLVDVLPNMSFDNKELEYDLVNGGETVPQGEVFKKNKKYYQKHEVNGVVTFTEYAVATSEIGTLIRTDKQLYETHPSKRYFVDADIAGLTTEAKLSQAAWYTGCSMWSTSNLRHWLCDTQNQYGAVPDITIKDYTQGEKTVWANEDTPPPTISWTANNNGWSHADAASSHHLAPASNYSARYINYPPFQNNFRYLSNDAPEQFLSVLATVRNSTITDQYVHRYTRSRYDDNVIEGNPIRAYTTNDSKFWLPSFEQIYGRRPVNGYNGACDAASVAGVTEGTQFEYFKHANFKAARTKYFVGTAEKANWYLRSCDPTTVGRVYYVGTDLPTYDTGTAIETTCTAHRPTGSGELKVGPAICFTVI